MTHLEYRREISQWKFNKSGWGNYYLMTGILKGHKGYLQGYGIVPNLSVRAVAKQLVSALWSDSRILAALLLVYTAPMLQPTRYMLIVGVTVRPMDNPTLGIPFIFTIELDAVSHHQSINFRGQVNVMRN